MCTLLLLLWLKPDGCMVVVAAGNGVGREGKRVERQVSGWGASIICTVLAYLLPGMGDHHF